jgi:hypothetical protein
MLSTRPEASRPWSHIQAFAIHTRPRAEPASGALVLTTTQGVHCSGELFRLAMVPGGHGRQPAAAQPESLSEGH